MPIRETRQTKSAFRIASEAIRALALEDMEFGTSGSNMDICTACGHTYSNMLVSEDGVRKTCGHCGVVCTQIHVTLSW